MKSNNCCRHIDDDNEPGKKVGRGSRMKQGAERREQKVDESRRQVGKADRGSKRRKKPVCCLAE